MAVTATQYLNWKLSRTSLWLMLGALACVSGTAHGYTLYTDRESWLSAVAEYAIRVENFDAIPDGLYASGTIPSTVFTNIEISPLNPLPVEINGSKVVRVLNRDLSVLMGFQRPVYAVGLDIKNPNNWFFQYGICEDVLSGTPCFVGESTTIDFIGWVADEGDSPLWQTFVFFDSARDEGFGWDNLAIAEANVVIDIKPGSERNPVNLRSKGIIPVAILTTESFDATQVAWESVEFGPAGATEFHEQSHVKDADGDGDADVVLHFRTSDTGMLCTDTEATLTGETFSGDAFTGADSISVVKCAK